MNRAYSRELSADTCSIIIPLISAITFIASLLMAILWLQSRTVWHLWALAAVSPLVAYTAVQLIRRDRIESGATLFISAHVGLLLLLIYQEWQPGSSLPYLFAVLIITGSMMRHPQASLIIWGVSSILTAVVIGLSQETFSAAYIYHLIAPTIVNFLLAVFAFLSAYEWRFAVESVSMLHGKARRRRDELFEMQQELSAINASLKALNRALDDARARAVQERDLRTRFMTSVSHELRTPLNSIVNFAHILAQGVRGPVTEEQADYLQRIEQAGWHLLAVLNDLLDMAQIEAGEFKLHLEPTNLHTICEEAIASTQGMLLERPVKLERIYPQTWPLVHADRMRIKQALINLLGNAVKYTEEGQISLHVQPNGRWVNISVIDTGIGIAAEHHERIFQEFTQVDENVARRRIGAGLGLPITRHLVERHGGQITVESAPGEGSTFTIKLPVWSKGGAETAVSFLPDTAQ